MGYSMVETGRTGQTERTGIVLDAKCLLHDPGPNHPESSKRLAVLMNAMQSAPMKKLQLVSLDLRDASIEEIERVHTAAYVERLERARGRRQIIDPDTMAGPRSFEAAVRAAGCAISATEAVARGDVRNAFALVRPPGHHARPDIGMGFCLFNNVAIAARHAQATLGMRRIAIVDFDVHHGNGTQEAFYADPSVLYVSTHQAMHFPGTGELEETGEGAGVGRTLNIPLMAGHGDREYDAIYGGLIARVLEQYRPDLILVSAGFDIFEADSYGGMQVSLTGIVQIAGHLKMTADQVCDGRLVFVLEGGYHLGGLGEGVQACLQVLTGYRPVRESRGPLMGLPLGDGIQAVAIAQRFFTL